MTTRDIQADWRNFSSEINQRSILCEIILVSEIQNCHYINHNIDSMHAKHQAVGYQFSNAYMSRVNRLYTTLTV